MHTSTSTSNFKSHVKLIAVAALIVLGLWFASKIVSILFLFFLAIVLTLILNAPTMWLVSKKMPRTGAALLVFFAMLLFVLLIGWLVIPKILEQVSTLVTNIPQYSADLQRQLALLLDGYPGLQKQVLDNSEIQNILPSLAAVASGLYRFSSSLVGGIFLLIVFLSIVIYMLIDPAPLIKTYLTFFSKEKRPKAAQALSKSSTMMVGWMWSNLLVGTMEAVLVFFFLTYMGVPGVWVWTGLALFAEMVPKLGLYIMAIPPVLIALTLGPLTALWVLAFYLALNEIMGDFVVPRIRASTMDLHPVSSLLVMIAMVGAFGIIGALIATPLTAFIKAYYETFYLESVSKEHLDEQVDIVLERKA